MAEFSERTNSEKLERAEQALEHCERIAIASQYASVVMHEVNNYLESITNLVYLAKLQCEDSAQVTSLMDSVDRQLQMLGDVTRRSLAYHRQRSEIRDVNLVEIVQAALKLHAETIQRHHVEVEIHFPESAVAAVREGEILQVVSNLILNALDALPLENGRISIRISDQHPWVQIVISDNGKGIPDELAESLFQPYVTSKPTGTGLGLWLSKRIIARHKGTIRFETSHSAGSSGSSFCVELPARIAA